MTTSSPYRPSVAGVASTLWLLIGSLAVVAVLTVIILRMGDRGGGSAGEELTVYCAAGMRVPMERIVQAYREETGVAVRLQYGGSNTLLSQIELAGSGDCYLAADDSYTQLAREKGLAAEELPVARMRPMVAVQAGNPKDITGIADLLREDVRVALGNPDQAAIGKRVRSLLRASGDWDALAAAVQDRGVFKPTVNDIATDVKTGSADATIVWDPIVAQFGGMEVVRAPELDAGSADITIAVLTTSQQPTAALRFARYVTARDRGLPIFAETGYEVVAGDRWARRPELTFFVGAVNRRAVETAIAEFAAREGVEINTVYNGCGILTSSMRMADEGGAGASFPDVYLACDVYYLDTVQQWFDEGTLLSETEVVIAVPPNNPAGIESLADLAKPGVRVVVGQPEQCTIGVLTRQLLCAAGLEEEIMANVVAEKPSSAMLLPDVVGERATADAALAYRSDCLASGDRVRVIRIDHEARRAVQPFAIAERSAHPQLAQRLRAHLLEQRERFEAAGFDWLADEPAAPGSQP